MNCRPIQLLVLAALGACSPERPAADRTPAREAHDPTAKAPHAADNTANNRGDAAAGAATPTDQRENASDLSITAELRKAILAQEDLSMNADNIKIMTADGAVTLRGVVETPKERDRVLELARQQAGVTRVDDQLEIAAH